MKTILICHSEDKLTRMGFARWLSSFTDLVGIIEIQEEGERAKQRIKAELRRIGILRFIFDMIPYRIYSRIVHATIDRSWVNKKLEELQNTFPEIPSTTEVLVTHSPNSENARIFIGRLAPAMIIARCKTLIKEEIFSIPKDGTFVLHPGMCPEYRNAHGCFWALANNEPDKVAMTLLKIDAGVDTGPIFGYYSYPFNVERDTPAIIHYRVVYDNLEALRDKLLDINAGKAKTITIEKRESNVWGQPWLSRYFRLKRRAKRS